MGEDEDLFRQYVTLHSIIDIGVGTSMCTGGGACSSFKQSKVSSEELINIYIGIKIYIKLFLINSVLTTLSYEKNQVFFSFLSISTH